MRIKLVSWNVNGLRAVSAKEEWRWFTENDAQVVALQETKAQPEQLSPEVASPQGWESHWASSTVKKGYSGVAVFSRLAPLAVRCELPEPQWQGEGRLLCAFSRLDSPPSSENPQAVFAVVRRCEFRRNELP